MGLSLLLTWYLEYRYFVNNAGSAWQFVFERPRVFLFNAFLMGMIMLIVMGIFYRPFLSAGVVGAFITAMTYAHINKFIVRGSPLLPEDLIMASEGTSLLKFVDLGGLVRMIVAMVLIIMLALWLDHLTRKFWQRENTKKIKNRWKRLALNPRVMMFLAGCLLFNVSTDFIRHHSGQRYEEIPWLNTKLVAWNQVRNYDHNGFIVGFLYNWSKFELAKPDGYSEQKIQEIAKKYNKIKAATEKNSQLIDLKDADFNIVVILNESFYDPDIISKYYPYKGSKELLPNYKNIKKKFPSGQMYSLDYGGGTANIEFEVLTGLSNYWANTVPYTDLLPRTGAIPALASYAKTKGYKTVAIHPFNGGMYKRNFALKNEGFDKFITEQEMKHTKHEGFSQYINDQSAYRETLDVLKKQKQKQMIGLITMQNHTPYDSDIYDHYDFHPLKLDDDPWQKTSFTTFMQLMHESDKYLGEFVSELEKMNEKTVVLFFGDHSPGVFYRVSDHPEKEVRDLSRLTPYFVYANFDLPKTDLPTNTPNCLSNTLFNVLGLKKPSMMYLLDQICKETPILTPFYFNGAEPFQSTELSSYQLINYDILGGKKYWKQYAK